MSGTGPTGQGGILGRPGLLAAGAAGLATTVAALWAFRGLPMGTALFWLTPLPLFTAGLAFGPGSAVAAVLLATLLIAAVGGGLPVLVFLVLFGVPAPALLIGAARGAGLGLPLAFLGVWPLLVLLGAAVFLADDGGIEAAMRRAVEVALVRLGLPAPETLVAELVRVKAAAIGFWAGIALLCNAAAAQRFLGRRGLLRAPPQPWTQVRLPGWYPALPAIAAGFALIAEGDAGAVPLSALLLLLLPLFLQGLAGVHARLAGRRGRGAMLAGFYLLVVLFLQLMGPGLVGLGLYDQLRRRATPRQS